MVVPLCLRDRGVGDQPDAEQLVIVSPHNEAIRFEFEQAFTAYAREHLGRRVDIDWRTPGGTSEIVRYVKSEYAAAFRQWWSGHGEWTPAVRNGFLNRKLREPEADPEAWRARHAFLASDVGIGIDLFFGGGQYDFGRMAAEGMLVPCGFRGRHAELFEAPVPVLRQQIGGEIWHDVEDRYYGACLSAFGICFNLDRWQELGLGAGPQDWPESWDDLADPRLLGQVGVADPSKSGSITKCFEMLIQQKMAEVVDAEGGGDAARTAGERNAALGQGWEEAMLLIRRIGGNARYFTFSASRVPVDVDQGTVAAGMCIDFYGRAQAEWSKRGTGRDFMRYVTPVGGSSVSADPIGLLRGAPHRELAEAFIDFVLAREGQKLWNYRAGESGGPTRYSLRRLPIRSDMYEEHDVEAMSDPGEKPLELATRFTYHPDWTGHLFGLIRVLLRVMIIDCHDELRSAWSAVCEAGGPEAVPQAMAQLRRLPFSYDGAGQIARELGDKQERVRHTRQWAAFFRRCYRDAEQLAQYTPAAGSAMGGQGVDGRVAASR